jgi:hypothetical protein
MQLEQQVRVIAGPIEGAALLVLFASAAIAFGGDNSPDTIAKYLAGLAVPAASATATEHSSDPPKDGLAAARVSNQPRIVSAPRTPDPPPSVPITPVPPHRRPGSSIPEANSPQSLTHSTSQPPVIPSTTEPLSDNPWIVHSTELDHAWKRTDEVQLAAIASWAPQALGQAYRENGTLFYMFSGPDFLYAHAFFPNARTYVMCGNEPVGSIPDFNKISADTLPAALANIRKSLESVLNWSFFITKNMKSDLTQTQLSGTLPLLYVFLARAGCSIESVAAVSIDNAGNLSDGEETGQTPGVRILFRDSASVAALDESRRSGAEVDDRRSSASAVRTSTINSQPSTLFYFCSDLSDDGVKSRPGFLRFCEKQGHGVSLLKAASYLMHEPGFSRVREFLLGSSETILQDDSGIPFRYFEPQTWDVQYFGPYVGPIDVFKKYWQPDLAEAYARSASVLLPFGFGYQWQPARSSLVVAERR